jgi:hypothetical protein
VPNTIRHNIDQSDIIFFNPSLINSVYCFVVEPEMMPDPVIAFQLRNCSVAFDYPDRGTQMPSSEALYSLVQAPHDAISNINQVNTFTCLL